MSPSVRKSVGWDKKVGPSLSRGLTLVEVLLTMSLFVVLAAIAWPAMTRPLANQRLRKAAEQVRADWTRARVKAMSSGKTYVFRYLPESDRYSVQPSNSGDAATEDAAAGGADLDMAATGQTTSAPSERVLPEGITFLQSDPDDSQARSALTGAGDLSDLGGGATFDAAGALGEIRFSPDGTTSTARVTLQNAFGRSIELRMRGLTGVVTVGDVLSNGTAQTSTETPLSEEARQP